MARTEDGFFALAIHAGLPLVRGTTLDWLTNRGHLGAVLPSVEASLLQQLYVDLGGLQPKLEAKRRGAHPRPDFIWPEMRLLVEVDEVQHFTTDRRKTFLQYPQQVSLAYDLSEYRQIVDRWARDGDSYRSEKQSVDFPFPGGRRAQRAYFDAFRDLAAPHHGFRVLRVPAPECDPKTTFRRFDRLVERCLIA